MLYALSNLEFASGVFAALISSAISNFKISLEYWNIARIWKYFCISLQSVLLQLK